MKVYCYIILLATGLLAALGCEKGPGSAPEQTGRTPISFEVESVPETKAFTATTASNLTSFYVTALKSDNSEFFKNVNFTGTSGGSFTGGWYWPASGALSFYAVSKSYTQTLSAGNITVSGNAASDGDVVRAAKTSVSNGTSSMALAFGHIYAALQGITFTAASGYTVTVTALSYQLKTTGTYNIATDAWSSVGALGGATAVASPSLSNTGIAALCVPATGNCKVTVTYTCARLGYSETYTRTSTVTLAKGYRNTVTGTLGPNPGVLDLDVTISPWTGLAESLVEM